MFSKPKANICTFGFLHAEYAAIVHIKFLTHADLPFPSNISKLTHYLCFYSVDAAKEDGSLGRLVNDDHLNPNAKMKYFAVKGKPHLCLFAARDINAGEELTYNYGDADWPWRQKVVKTFSICEIDSN